MNCGAVIEQTATKCAYCGTSYVDICGLKLDGHTPFVLNFETEVNGHRAIISSWMVANPNFNIQLSTDSVVYTDQFDTPSFQFIGQRHLTANFEFQAIEHNGELTRIEIQD